ncbi:MAG TPA: glycoside hydrolase family 3 N-terminal domain-containing protein [Actinomycetota bacterium]|nr:glycoside hydrolase family 3 N-terminal domain-containing protein [Actinomycetota bacterium]
MSDAQRVGQLFIVGLRRDRLGPADMHAILADHLGSVTFIEPTSVGVQGVRRVADAVQTLATKQNTGSVRFFVAANQEGGQIQSLQGPGFSRIPSALAQGRLPAPNLQADALSWGRQLLSAGVNFELAPVMDVVPAGTDPQNAPIGALQREFGHDPSTVGTHGVAFLRGMQRARLATSAKHFPGLGRVRGNTDFTGNVVDRVTTANDPYLQPFRDAIAARVPFVMVALATYTRIDPNHLAVFSPTVMAILRERMAFRGVIVSDDIGAARAIAQIPIGRRAVDFLAAGGDMIISKFTGPAVVMEAAILSRAAADPAFRAMVDQAVLRVLRAKAASGLLPCAGA